jgi:hypothetical protein
VGAGSGDLPRSTFHIRLKAIDASDLFLDRLSGVEDPERKRVIIGNTFVEVFEQGTDEVAEELGRRPEFLAQGTLYPDVIESVSFKGPSATIKTHHNVGGLPEKLNFGSWSRSESCSRTKSARSEGCWTFRTTSSVDIRFPGPGPRNPRDRSGNAR